MHLLDTDTLTHFHAAHPRVVQHVRMLPESDVGITVVTRIEILRARFEFLLKASDGQQLLRAQTWLERSERLMRGLLVVPFDQSAANHFDRLRRNTRLKKIGRADCSSPALHSLVAPCWRLATCATLGKCQTCR